MHDAVAIENVTILLIFFVGGHLLSFELTLVTRLSLIKEKRLYRAQSRFISFSWNSTSTRNSDSLSPAPFFLASLFKANSNSSKASCRGQGQGPTFMKISLFCLRAADKKVILSWRSSFACLLAKCWSCTFYIQRLSIIFPAWRNDDLFVFFVFVQSQFCCGHRVVEKEAKREIDFPRLYPNFGLDPGGWNKNFFLFVSFALARIEDVS